MFDLAILTRFIYDNFGTTFTEVRDLSQFFCSQKKYAVPHLCLHVCVPDIRHYLPGHARFVRGREGVGRDGARRGSCGGGGVKA